MNPSARRRTGLIAARPVQVAALVLGALVASACGASAHQAAPPADPTTSIIAAAATPIPLPTPPVSPAATSPAASPPTATPEPTPCTANERSRYVFVSLHRQHMWLCAKHTVAYTTAITSGMVGQDTETPTGTFHIEGLNRNSVLTLSDGATYHVRYWIPFDAPLFGFHDSSWQHFPYGSPKYRTAGSHGCVHVPLKAIGYLYRWADIGTTVRIKA